MTKLYFLRSVVGGLAENYSGAGPSGAIVREASGCFNNKEVSEAAKMVSEAAKKYHIPPSLRPK